MSARVLLVEDAAPFRRMMASFLKQYSFEVYEAWSLKSARQLLPSVQPTILLLDIELEDGESFDLLREAACAGISAIVVSARSSVHDRLKALQLGAEDYMMKPLSFLELRLRMQRLAGSSRDRHARNAVDFGTFVIDFARRRVTHCCGQAFELSPAELLLAQLFIDAGEKILSRETIARQALGRRVQEQSRAVDMLVSKLRRKLDPTRRASLIWAVRGDGYRFDRRRGSLSRSPEGPPAAA